MLTAEAVPGGFRLNGMSPWVTGGAAADVLVLAATVVGSGTATDHELLIAAPTDIPGLTVADALPLVGVSASSTGPVHLHGVEVSNEWVVAGPMPNVMASGVGAGTGGLETSTLAIGLARGAIDFLAEESSRRADLREPAVALKAEHQQLVDDLLSVVRGEPRCSKEFRRSASRTACRCGRVRRRRPRRRVQDTSWDIRPADGAARPCSFWCGAAPNP